MWSCTLVAPLVDSTPSPDAADLLGVRTVVEHIEETHYAVDAGVDLRRIVRIDGTTRDAFMTLRVRSAHHYSAGSVECWTMRPTIKLKSGATADADVAWAECLPWLRMQAEKIAARSPALGKNIARSHAAPAADPSHLLGILARMDTPPPHVVIRRRKLRSSVPSETGALYEQSDLEVGGRLWRAITAEATNPLVVQKSASPLREAFRGGFHLSFPQFVQMILRTWKPADPPEQRTRETGGGGANQREALSELELNRIGSALTAQLRAEMAARLSQKSGRSDHSPARMKAPRPVADGRWDSVAGSAATGSGGYADAMRGSSEGGRAAVPSGSGTLQARLIDAWYASADVFSQRCWRAEQEHQPSWQPVAPRKAAVRVEAGGSESKRPVTVRQAHDQPAPEPALARVAPPAIAPFSPAAALASLSEDSGDTSVESEEEDGSSYSSSSTKSSSSQPTDPPEANPAPPPVSRADTADSQLKPAVAIVPPGVPLAQTLAASEATYRSAGMAAAAAKAAEDAALDAGEAAAIAFRSLASSPAAEEARAALEAGAGYGLLALFPSHVVRRAIGEAASSGDTLQLQQLLTGSRGAHLNAACEMPKGTRRTPLHCAAAEGHEECVELLLRHSAEVLASAEGGRTALHLAALGGSPAHAACAKLLVRYGGDATQPDLKGMSAIELAPPRSACAMLLGPLAAIMAHDMIGGGMTIRTPRYWVHGTALMDGTKPPTVPEMLAARNAARDATTASRPATKFTSGAPQWDYRRAPVAAGLTISAKPFSGATSVRRGVADLPGGAMRYNLTPPEPPPPKPWVMDLSPNADMDGSAIGAWWCMQHPLDHASVVVSVKPEWK